MRIKELWRIFFSARSFFGGFVRVFRVVSQVWLFDWLRPGILTGFQTRSPSLENNYMWYSPVETKVAQDMISFAREFAVSWAQYSEKNSDIVFVDLGVGSGKASLIALEVGFSFAAGVDVDENLVELSGRNASRLKRLKKNVGESRFFVGDVSSREVLRQVRDEVANSVDGEPIYVFFNKNSYGRPIVRKSLENLTSLLGRFIYIYNNPVHEAELVQHGLFINRRFHDRKLRKNRDWLLATFERNPPVG